MHSKLRIFSAVAAIVAAFLLIPAQAQQSSLSATEGAPGTSTTSAAEAKPAKASPWKGGVLFLVDRYANVKDVSEDATSTSLQTETHFRLKYQTTENDSFSLIQRVFYNQSVAGNVQTNPTLGNLRLEYNRTGQLMKGDASLVGRVTLPTNLEARRDSHFLGTLTAIPEIYWNLNPKWTVGYSGSLATEFYDDTAQTQGAAATAVTFFNSGVVTYNLTNKVSLSQSVGLQDYNVNSRRQLDHPERQSQTIELATGVSVNPTKDITLVLAALQSAPTMPGSIRTSTGKVLSYESDFNLYSRDQTTYEFTGSVNF